MKTNWVKYRVASRGSSGTWTYVYSPYICSCSDGEQAIAEEIVERYESWARYVEWHRVEWGVNVWPPIRRLHSEIVSKARHIENLKMHLLLLEKQFEILSEIE